MTSTDDRVRQGNRLLLARLILGLGLGFAGLLAHAHLIGPHGYGLYASAAALVLATQAIASWGVPFWLVRQAPVLDSRSLSASVSVLLMAGSASSALAALCSSFVLTGELGDARDIACFMLGVLMLTIPFQVGLATLERAQRYRLISLVELSANVVFVGLGVLLAWYYRSPWALAIAWAAQEIVLASAWRLASGVPIAFGGDRTAMREVFDSGWRNASVSASWQARAIITPLVVGHLCDAAAVGLTQLAAKMVTSASTLRHVIWRTSGPALAALRHDPQATLKFERTAAIGLSLGVGLPLVLLAVVTAMILPLLLGPRWSDLSMAVPFYAAASLASCVSTPPTAALIARERSLDVTFFSLISTITLLIACVVLVPLVGWTGALIAELVAIPALVVLLRAHHRLVGPVHLRPAMLGALAMAVGSAFPLIGWPALAAPALWMLMSPEHRSLRHLLGTGNA
jgi:O-antigen/teichoic acid export membrane protein